MTDINLLSVLTLQEFLTCFAEAVSIFVAHPALCDRVLPQCQHACGPYKHHILVRERATV